MDCLLAIFPRDPCPCEVELVTPPGVTVDIAVPEVTVQNLLALPTDVLRHVLRMVGKLHITDRARDIDAVDLVLIVREKQQKHSVVAVPRSVFVTTVVHTVLYMEGKMHSHRDVLPVSRVLRSRSHEAVALEFCNTISHSWHSHLTTRFAQVSPCGYVKFVNGNVVTRPRGAREPSGHRIDNIDPIR